MNTTTCPSCGGPMTEGVEHCPACAVQALPLRSSRRGFRLLAYVLVGAVASAAIWMHSDTSTPHQATVPASLVALTKSNQTARKVEASRLAAIEQAKENATACRSVFAPFVQSLHRIDDDLEIGVTYAQYTKRLKQANYRRHEAADRMDAVTKNCVHLVGAPAESVLAAYDRVQMRWYRCTFIPCDVSATEHMMHTIWRGARRHLHVVDGNLKRLLREGDPDPSTGAKL